MLETLLYEPLVSRHKTWTRILGVKIFRVTINLGWLIKEMDFYLFTKNKQFRESRFIGELIRV